ncbi:GIY-YIG nuclease family protein [bacterium]|nr:GIY-YIG nuclease family protein [bacterium]
MYYTYILLLSNNQFYIGSTNNLKRRIDEHKRKRKQTFKLIFYEAFVSKEDARRREKYFKTSKGKSSLKQILRNSLLNK